MTEGEMCDEVVPVLQTNEESMEAMTAAELTEKLSLQILKHRIQFKQVDPEHFDECKPHSQPRPMRISRSGMEGTQGTSGNTRTKTLSHQARIEAEFHVEEEKAAEIKKQVQTAKNSPEAQQLRAAAALKEVAEMQQNAIRVAKFKLQRAQERSRTQREDV